MYSGLIYLSHWCWVLNISSYFYTFSFSSSQSLGSPCICVILWAYFPSTSTHGWTSSMRRQRRGAMEWCGGGVMSVTIVLRLSVIHLLVQTFCVVSKRFKKNYIHRFTGTKSLFLFEPWSKTRRICVYIATNQFFDYVVMATILCNCIFLAMTETIEEAE